MVAARGHDRACTELRTPAPRPLRGVPRCIPVAELLLWCEACSANNAVDIIPRDRPARLGGPWWRLECGVCGNVLGGWNQAPTP